MTSVKSLLLATAAAIAFAAAPAHAQIMQSQLIQAPAGQPEKEGHKPAPHGQPPAKPSAPAAQPQHPAPPPQAPRPPQVAHPPAPATPSRPAEQHVPQPHKPAQTIAPQHEAQPPKERTAPVTPIQPKQTQPAPATTPVPSRPSQATPPATPSAERPSPQRSEERRNGQRPAGTGPSPAEQKTAPTTSILPPASAPPPPQQPRDASQFIRKPGEGPSRTIQDLRRERQQTKEGNATVIREGDRTIIREGGRTIIRHSEADRFAVGARDVHVEHRGNEITTVIVRPNGDRIVTITDDRGRLLRRVRREPNGREIVIIDETGIPRRGDLFVTVPPPRRRLPPDRYFVDIDRAPPERIYDTLIAAPLEPVDEVYTLGQVRYSQGLRMLMPRVDLDINFDSGSWQITPDQFGKLEVIARALNRAIDRNPREVFLIEGHTDAVGTDEDNLSLSDRRAESVAVALTQEFGVPPENLITQGYGEQELKVPTGGPSRENRRVAVRRITPLIDRTVRR